MYLINSWNSTNSKGRCKMTIAFAGHSYVCATTQIKKLVTEQIKSAIVNEDFVTFYIGGYGDFDSICAQVCKELKQERPGIEVVYVTPYISLSEQSKIDDLKRFGLCDSTIYPPIENIPPRFAILKRNEWMMTNADLIIAYVKYNSGGAYKSLQIAKRREKRIINICDILQDDSNA